MSKRVLLTGANGFVGQHVLQAFLAAGHSVRAVVRSQAKADQLAQTFRLYAGSSRLDFGVVPDMTAAGAYDQALVVGGGPPFDAVVHTASPFNYRTNSTPAEFLVPAVHGTTEILTAVKRLAPTVRRVVVTSSMAAVIDFAAPKTSQPPRVYSERVWNPSIWDQASAEDAHLGLAYQASKKFAELAAWDIAAGRDPTHSRNLAKEELTQEFLSGAAAGAAGADRPGFDVVALCPPMVYGPVFDPDDFATPQALNQSTWVIYQNFLDKGKTADDPVPPEFLHLYVDVRDIAAAHLLAVETPAAGGQRFVVTAGGISNQRIANVLRATLPELADRIPRGNPDQVALPEGSYEGDSSLAKKVLGLTFRSDEETFADLAHQLRDIDQRAS